MKDKISVKCETYFFSNGKKRMEFSFNISLCLPEEISLVRGNDLNFEQQISHGTIQRWALYWYAIK